MSQREVHVYQARGEHSVHALFGLSSEVGLFVIQAFNWKSNGRGIQNPGYPVARLWVLSQNPFSLHSYDVVLVSSCAHLVQQSEDIRPLNCFSTLYHFHAPNKFKSCCRHDYEHLLRKSVPSVAGCYQTWRFVQRHFFTSDNPLDPSPRILLLDDFPISNILFWQAEKQHMANLLVTDLSPHWRQARVSMTNDQSNRVLIGIWMWIHIRIRIWKIYTTDTSFSRLGRIFNLPSYFKIYVEVGRC